MVSDPMVPFSTMVSDPMVPFSTMVSDPMVAPMVAQAPGNKRLRAPGSLCRQVVSTVAPRAR
jgi:hypothetical protein